MLIVMCHTCVLNVVFHDELFDFMPGIDIV